MSPSIRHLATYGATESKTTHSLCWSFYGHQLLCYAVPISVQTSMGRICDTPALPSASTSSQRHDSPSHFSSQCNSLALSLHPSASNPHKRTFIYAFAMAQVPCAQIDTTLTSQPVAAPISCHIISTLNSVVFSPTEPLLNVYARCRAVCDHVPDHSNFLHHSPTPIHCCVFCIHSYGIPADQPSS